MIYLIDDKKTRQQLDFGWSIERLEKYSESLISFYTYEDMKGFLTRELMFSSGNIILFHESFFDNSVNNHIKDSIDIREDLNKFAAENDGWVVFFSGSKNSRTLKDRIAHVPVSVLYENLEAFIEKAKLKIIDLRYLLYGGQNPEIEETLLIRLKDSNNQFDETPIISDRINILVLAGSRNNIPIIIKDAVEKTFTLEEKYDKQITSQYLNDKVLQWLSSEEVDNIFIPLCFGPSLSDYNGLQFACHIRCTNSVNQLKPIFIYSFVDYSFVIENEYSNILKSKNVFLISYSREAFKDGLNRKIELLTNEQLVKEIKKLKLNVPLNYEDSHSIANEWAIYRWAESIGVQNIERVRKNVASGLYFKYLRTIYSTSQAQLLSEDQLKIKYFGNPKILYIDDEAEKGWHEIFHRILYELNGISFAYLDEEFNSKTQEELIKTSLEKIANDDIDLVILDFRLHPNDFITNNIENVTGLKILKKIKNLNAGIQVIIFSATNKVWNLQAFLDAGADGFVVKESPEFVINKTSTCEYIQSMCTQISNRLEYTYLIGIWNLHQAIRKAFSKNPLTKKYFAKQLDEQVNAIKYQNLLLQELEAIFHLLNTTVENRYNLTMIMLYKILEYLNEIFYQKTDRGKMPKFYDGPEVEYYDKNNKQWKKINEKVPFYNKTKGAKESTNIKSEWVDSTSNKILNLASKKLKISDDALFLNLIQLSDYRNAFIHSDTTKRNNLRILKSKDIIEWTYSITTVITHI